MKVLGAVLLGAAMSMPYTSETKAQVNPVLASPTFSGTVIVLPATPAISLTDGTVTMAQHYSHASHSSHASHASHYSSYSPY